MRRMDRILAVGVGVSLFTVASAWVVDRYGGASYWPSLIAQFAATLLAVVLALEFEARRERRALLRGELELNDIRSTEARKRLLSLATELEKNDVSIKEIIRALQDPLPAPTFKLIHPQLLAGTWAASGERLGDLLSEYELVARVSTFYGRLEELRWRIRHRTEARDEVLNSMTLALAKEMQQEVTTLIRDVRAQEQNPSVRRLGVTHTRAVSSTLHLTASVSAEKVPGESPDS